MTDLHPLLPLVAALSLAAATLISEDLTCIAAGVLVAEGQLSFPLAVAGCLAGIVAGDVALMLLGRTVGERVLAWPRVARLAGRDRIGAVREWFARRGVAVVALSRFLPGTRLATYLTAGALGMPLSLFVLLVAASGMVWVPALVGLAVAGGEVFAVGILSGTSAALRGAAAATVLGSIWWLASRSGAPGWRTWRKLIGFGRRCFRWEFWPSWVLYAPVVACIAFLAVKYRSLTLFTAANPDIPAGGFIGESKFEILKTLTRTGGGSRSWPAADPGTAGWPSGVERVALAALLPAGPSAAARAAAALRFTERAGLDYPVVIKPDQGQRGAGVTIVRSRQELVRRIAASGADLIIQEYVPGLEFGVFYYRHPAEARGRILSITEKRFPAVTGDGRRSLEELILADERAVCLNRIHRDTHRATLTNVPAAGTAIPLVEIGSHCRGALFLDASHLTTPALENAFDGIAQRFGGFYFGRFDVRAPSIEAFTTAADFRILELNGVTSEATHIYDPRYGVLTAWRVLCRQWRLAFEIGAENRRRGVAPTSLAELIGQVIRYRQWTNMHPGQAAS